MKKGKIVFLVILFQVVLFSVILEGVMPQRQNVTDGGFVGVEVGDWVKYTVKRAGQPTTWIPPPMEETIWLRVEVLGTSGSTVMVRQTFHLTDGSESNHTISGSHYIIPANLDAGEQIPVDYTIVLNETHFRQVEELLVNSTLSKDYLGVSRDVNMLNWSYLTYYFQYTLNITEEFHWDKKTGFLLTRKFRSYVLGYGNTSVSILQLDVIDTNLFETVLESESIWGQWRVYLFSGAIIAISVGVLVTLKSFKRKPTYVNGKKNQ